MKTTQRKSGRPKNKIESQHSSAAAKGMRLKRVRNLANLSREQLCSGSDVNIHTLIGWECGRFGGLTLVGTQRIIKRLEQEGVFCSAEWLLNENGAAPIVSTDYLKNNESTYSDDVDRKSVV
jgi:transcriptional regulator with XRE-family HTH domain